MEGSDQDDVWCEGELFLLIIYFENKFAAPRCFFLRSRNLQY